MAYFKKLEEEISHSLATSKKKKKNNIKRKNGQKINCFLSF